MKTNCVPFDENAIGASLVLTVNDTYVETSANVDAHRIARSRYGQTNFASSVEFYIWSPNADSPSLAPVAGVPPLTVGIVTNDASLSKYVGEDQYGWGYCPGDGKVRNNGSVVATFSTSALNAYIGVTLDPIAGQITFTSNGTVLGVITSITGTSWYYAATVSGLPGDLAVWANAGQTPLRYATSAGGWYHLAIGIDPLYLATEPYITAPTDTAPNFKYSGAVDRMQSPMSISRSVMPWPFGASAPPTLGKGSQTQIEILDPAYQYGELLSLDIRDQTAIIERVPHDEAFTNAENVFEAIIDHCEQKTDQTKTLYCNDKLVLLQSQLIRALFAPNADPSVAGKPRPLSSGICRTYAPNLYDNTNFLFGAADEPLSALGKGRIQGKELGYGIDFTITADAEGFDLPTAPAGKFTVETTTFGGKFDATLTDLLGGDGVFGSTSVGSNGQPHNWAGNGGYGSAAGPTHSFQLTGSSPNKYVRTDQVADGVFWLKHATATVAPGQACAFQIILKNTLPYYGSGIDANGNPIKIPPGIMGFAGFQNFNAQFYMWGQVSIASTVGTGPWTFTGTFINTNAITLDLTFIWLCNNLIQGSGGHTEHLDISSIIVVPLPALLTNVTLDGPGLDLMLQDLLISHGPLELADYDSTGAQAIDSVTGYKYGIHYGPNETPTVQDAAKRVLDSACADVYVERTGTVTAFQLTAPELSPTSSGSLTVTDIKDYLQPYPDLAENLTTRMSGCPQPDKYSESDFGSVSQADVPQLVRKLLEQDYQWTVTANATIATRYIHAQNAQPLGSQLDRQADGQAEITRVCGLYAQPRNFYVGTFFSPLGTQFDIGQFWDVTYPLDTLKDGQRLVIVGVQEQPSEELTVITFWGL